MQELRTQFLACREVWLAGLVSEVDVEGAASTGGGGSGGGGVYDALRRLTDIHRLHLFDAVMQFRAVFADEASLSANFVRLESIKQFTWMYGAKGRCFKACSLEMEHLANGSTSETSQPIKDTFRLTPSL